MAIVSMPEASVHKNNCPVFWQTHIGFTGQIIAMDPISKASRMERLSDLKFRFGVFALDT